MANKNTRKKKASLPTIGDILMMGWEPEKMKVVAKRWDKLTVELAKKGASKDWNSTEELRKLRSR